MAEKEFLPCRSGDPVEYKDMPPDVKLYRRAVRAVEF